MTTQSTMRPPMQNAAPASVGAWTPEMIAQCVQDTGYTEDQVKAKIAETGAQTPQELFPQLYSGAGIEPQGPPPDAGMAPEGAAPPPEAAAPPPAAAPMEGGEGLSPEGVAAMQMAMKHEQGPPMPGRRQPAMHPRR